MLGALLFFCATAFAGATQHLPALLLRAVVVVACVRAWPRASDAVFPPFAAADIAVPTLAVLAATWGVVHAPNPGLALQPWLSALLVVLVYFTGLVGSAQAGARLLPYAWAIGGAHGVWAIAQRLSGSARAHGGFFNPNDLAAFLAPLTLWALAEALAPTSPRRHPGWAVGTAVVGLLGVGCTASRAGALALALGGACLIAPRLGRRVFVVLVPLLLVLLTVVALRDRFLDHTDPYAYARPAIWRASAEVALATPLGVGLGAYADSLRRHGVPLPGLVHYPRLATQAHNEALQAWVEIGWLGLAAALAAPALLAWTLWRQRRRHPVAADWAILLSFALPAATAASLHVPPVAVLAAFWAAQVRRREVAPAADAAGRRRALPARRLVALVGVGGLALALPAAVGVGALQAAATAREAGDLPRARTLADAASTVMPWSVGAHLMVQSLRYAQGEPRLDIAARLTELGEMHPDQPDPLLRAAQVLSEAAAHAGNTPAQWRAIAGLWAQVAERDPRNAVTWTELGVAHRRAGAADAARAAWQRAIVEEPHCARALAYLADDARHAAATAVAADAAATAERFRLAAQIAAEAASSRRDPYGRAILGLDTATRQLIHPPAGAPADVAPGASP